MENHQAPEGVVSYQNRSSHIQIKIFERLLSSINIEEGWKILDFGCGTGKGTALLADIVGPKGYVYGTDPIIERIVVAKQNYKGENIEFHVGYATDSPKYGTEFDLVTSSFVMHWLPYDEKLITFKKVSECLKAGGPGFHFIASSGQKVNYFGLLDLLPKELSQKSMGDFFFENGESYKKMALENGFDKVSHKEVFIELPFKSLEDYFKWIAGTLHNNNYETFLKCLRKIPDDHDVSFLYNDKGEVVITDTIVFVTCEKTL